MKIDISKKELQDIRDIIYKGRENYRHYGHNLDHKNMFGIGTKLIRKINYELKKIKAIHATENFISRNLRIKSEV